MIRRILITGANKGIGRAAVAAVLSAHDDTFVYLGARDRARGEDAREALTAKQPSWAKRIEVVELDVSNASSVTAASKRVEGLHAVVNNAGIGFADYDMRTVLDVNTRGPKRVCETFVPRIREGGRIVNVASAS